MSSTQGNTSNSVTSNSLFFISRFFHFYFCFPSFLRLKSRIHLENTSSGVEHISHLHGNRRIWKCLIYISTVHSKQFFLLFIYFFCARAIYSFISHRITTLITIITTKRQWMGFHGRMNAHPAGGSDSSRHLFKTSPFVAKCR